MHVRICTLSQYTTVIYTCTSTRTKDIGTRLLVRSRESSKYKEYKNICSGRMLDVSKINTYVLSSLQPKRIPLDSTILEDWAVGEERIGLPTSQFPTIDNSSRSNIRDK